MKMFFVYVTALLLAFSCKENKQKAQLSLNASYIKKYPLINNQNNVDTLINMIRKFECYNSRFTGFPSLENEVYAYYLKLNQLTSDTVLFNLIDDKSPILRIYAYKGLLDKKSTFIPIAKSKMEAYMDSVCWISNDVRIEIETKELVKTLKADFD